MRLNLFQIAALFFGAVGASLVCGCNRSTAQASPTGPTGPPIATVQITHPKRGEITRSITLPSFNVRPYQEATLYAKVAGYLRTITVDKGDRVERGQLLAEIEVPEMAADLAK